MLPETAASSPADFWVARLSGDHAAIVWPKAEAMLRPSVARSSGLFTLEDVRERVTGNPDWRLWLLAEGDQLLGTWVTHLEYYPREVVPMVVFAGGSEMERWYTRALAETEKYAVELGCKRLRCGGRKGWAKFGWTPIGSLFERMIAP